jgi:hypothetical protein
LCQCKIGARFVSNVPQDRKSFWTHPLELLVDEAQVEACFGSFGDCVSVGSFGDSVSVSVR